MHNTSPLLRGIYLFAGDVAASVAFYQQLGLTVEIVSEDLARLTWANGTILEIGSSRLTSSYDPGWRTPGHPSKNSLNFEFTAGDKVDATHDRLVAAGYTSALAPCDPPWQSRFAIVNDPDGNSIGLHGPRDLAADRRREVAGH